MSVEEHRRGGICAANAPVAKARSPVKPLIRLPRGICRPRRGDTLPSSLSTVALTGLLTGLIALAVWTSRGAAQRATCTTQMRQLAGALVMYRTEHGG